MQDKIMRLVLRLSAKENNFTQQKWNKQDCSWKGSCIVGMKLYSFELSVILVSAFLQDVILIS